MTTVVVRTWVALKPTVPTLATLSATAAIRAALAVKAEAADVVTPEMVIPLALRSAGIRSRGVPTADAHTVGNVSGGRSVAAQCTVATTMFWSWAAMITSPRDSKRSRKVPSAA